jgi:hypothetical protein
MDEIDFDVLVLLLMKPHRRWQVVLEKGLDRISLYVQHLPSSEPKPEQNSPER